MSLFRCVVFLALILSMALGYLFELQVFPLEALSLAEKGLINTDVEGPFTNIGSIALAIEEAPFLRVKQLKGMLIALSNVVRNKGLLYISENPCFEACRSCLYYINGLRFAVEGPDMGSKVLLKNFKDGVGTLLGVMNALIDKPESTSTGLENLINELINAFDRLVERLGGEWIEEMVGPIRDVGEIRTKLHEYFKSDPSKLGTIRTKLIALNNLCTFADQIESKKESEILEMLGELQWFFDSSSLTNGYLNVNTRANVDLGQLAEELRGLAMKAPNEDFGKCLEFEFTFLSTVSGSSAHRPRAQNLDRRIQYLTGQVSHHLNGIERPNLLEEIYEKYTEIETIVKSNTDSEPMLRRRELREVIIIFIFYLLKFKHSPEAFEQIYGSNESKVKPLITSIMAFLDITSSKYDDLTENNNLNSNLNIKRLISILEQEITVLLKREIPLHRQVFLGHRPKGDKSLIALKIFEIREKVRAIYHHEIIKYLDRECEALLSVDGGETCSDVTIKMSDRVNLIVTTIGLGLTKEFYKVTKTKNWLDQMLQDFRAIIVDEILPDNHELDLISFYHRYVFPEIHKPVDEIRENIDYLIMNIESYIKGEEYTVGGPMKEDTTVSLPEQWSIIASFLQFFKEQHDKMSKFPGIEPFPFEAQLYELSNRFYSEIIDHKYLDKIHAVLLDLLFLLRNWRPLAGYKEEPDFFNELEHKKAIEKSRLKGE